VNRKSALSDLTHNFHLNKKKGASHTSLRLHSKVSPIFSYEQPLKSERATFVTVAGVTDSGALFASVEVMISDGEQSGVPPLLGKAASASTVNRTGAAAGVE